MIYLQLFLEFARVGLFAIGGGMASVPFLMDLADRTGWYTQAQLVDMIAISESTPGPIGINMATYVGFTTAGVVGSVCATLGMVLPSLVLVCIVARFFQVFRSSPVVQGAMYGLRPAATGLIAAAGLSVILLSIVNLTALKNGVIGQVIDWKSGVLAVVLFVLTNYVKPTKELHPVVFIAVAALAGVVFGFAGV